MAISPSYEFFLTSITRDICYFCYAIDLSDYISAPICHLACIENLNKTDASIQLSFSRCLSWILKKIDEDNKLFAAGGVQPDLGHAVRLPGPQEL